MDSTHRRRPVIDSSRYAGQWVALHPETFEVVAHDELEGRAKQAAELRGAERPVMYHVRKSDAYFVGPASPLCR